MRAAHYDDVGTQRNAGGYSQGTEEGCRLTANPLDPARPGKHMGEMTAACRHFAARGFVCITMTYRLLNKQTGGGLAPTNWSTPHSPLHVPWPGGFRPAPQAIYPAVRDTKAAIRWLRGNAADYNVAADYFGAGGWSAGACTTIFLATQYEDDFKYMPCIRHPLRFRVASRIYCWHRQGANWRAPSWRVSLFV